MRYDCDICGKPFNSAEAARQHNEAKHAGKAHITAGNGRRVLRRQIEEKDAEIASLKERIDNAAQAMAETQPSWERRCHAIINALGLDFGDPLPELPEQSGWYARSFSRLEKQVEQLEGENRQLRVVQEGYALVPKEPMPEVVGAWNRFKNGHHFNDEPPPTDTSCYGAYRAMIAEASKLANRQLRLAFASVNPEAQWTDDTDKACTACGGSGHIDDMKRAT